MNAALQGRKAGGRLAMIGAALCALIATLAAAGPARAADPGRWIETGNTQVPIEYFQGITSDQHRNLYFDGFFSGLYGTNSDLLEFARAFNAIPNDVGQREGYNHIGDITFDKREGGRILLPLECYIPGLGNRCHTGSIGVADPATAAWRYYVKLDPAYIDKAMWAEASPDGKLLWTSNGGLNGGHDLLAYDMAEITAANAAPGGPLLEPVRILPGAVPPSGITGATFYKHSLLLAGQSGGLFQVWAVDTNDGSRRLEIEKPVVGESEGLDIVKALGGILHWQITPFQTGGRPPTYGDGEHTSIVQFVPAHGGKGKEF